MSDDPKLLMVEFRRGRMIRSMMPHLGSGPTVKPPKFVVLLDLLQRAIVAEMAASARRKRNGTRPEDEPTKLALPTVSGSGRNAVSAAEVLALMNQPLQPERMAETMLAMLWAGGADRELTEADLRAALAEAFRAEREAIAREVAP